MGFMVLGEKTTTVNYRWPRWQLTAAGLPNGS